MIFQSFEFEVFSVRCLIFWGTFLGFFLTKFWLNLILNFVKVPPCNRRPTQHFSLVRQDTLIYSFNFISIKCCFISFLLDIWEYSFKWLAICPLGYANFHIVVSLCFRRVQKCENQQTHHPQTTLTKFLIIFNLLPQ